MTKYCAFHKKKIKVGRVCETRVGCDCWGVSGEPVLPEHLVSVRSFHSHGDPAVPSPGQEPNLCTHLDGTTEGIKG